MNVDWRRPDGAQALPDAVTALAGGLLDPGRVAVALGAPHARDAPRLVDAYYYPGRGLQALYRLADGSVVTVEGADVARRGRAEPGEDVLAELGARTRRFPSDPGLPALPAVVDQVGDAAEVLRYTPGRRCVLATDVDVAKVRRAEHAARDHAVARMLWTAAGRRFRMARPVAVDPRLGSLWERRVPGQAAALALAQLAPDVLAAALARQLAALHALPPVGLPLRELGAAQVLLHLQRPTWLALSAALPSVLARAQALAARLVAAGPPSGSGPVLVHGSFHPANVVLDGDDAVLLDLDGVAKGDPELDLALFTSQLVLIAHHVAAHDPRRAQVALAVAAALPEAYGAARGRLVDAAAYGWYLAACLLDRQLALCVRHLAPDLEALVGGLLDVAEQALTGAPPSRHAPLAPVDGTPVGGPVLGPGVMKRL